jgi:hypothetical protein
MNVTVFAAGAPCAKPVTCLSSSQLLSLCDSFPQRLQLTETALPQEAVPLAGAEFDDAGYYVSLSPLRCQSEDS